MNKKISFSISFAAIWILFRIILHTIDFGSQIKLGFFVNILFIITLMMVTLHFKIKEEKKLEPFLVNFKNSLKNAGMYIIIVVGFIFIYHQFVNPDYLRNYHEQRMKVEYKKTENFEELKKNTPGIRQYKTKEKYLENAENVSKIFTSKKLIITLYFGGLFMMSLIFSVLIPLFYKKLVLRM